MFERFSESTRRSIFFARFEAGRLGFEQIETAHLLLGLLREFTGEGESIIRRVLSHDEIESQRAPAVTGGALPSILTAGNAQELERKFSQPGPRSEALPTHGDMPLSSGARSVLVTAAAYAEDKIVTPLHLLWAMLDDDQGDVAESLKAAGITREGIDKEIRGE